MFSGAVVSSWPQSARGAAPHGDCWQRKALPASSHEHLGTEARSHSKCVGWVLHMGFTHDFGWVLHMLFKDLLILDGFLHDFTWRIKSTRGQHNVLKGGWFFDVFNESR